MKFDNRWNIFLLITLTSFALAQNPPLAAKNPEEEKKVREALEAAQREAAKAAKAESEVERLERKRRSFLDKISEGKTSVEMEYEFTQDKDYHTSNKTDSKTYRINVRHTF